ncbi:MAG: hypothetical protein H8D23_03815 [Candidatus Brocadiales bacterium]|nr:hypothetical protein [Candidatus Brocadiales bacterium]
MVSAIRHFPDINSEDKKTYQKVELYKRYHRISERAAKIIDKHEGEDDVYKLLYYEHIIPVSSTISALLDLGRNPSREAVREVLSETEVIILSKEESKILDGNVNSMYPLEEEKFHGMGLKSRGSKAERLNSMNIKFDKRYPGSR